MHNAWKLGQGVWHDRPQWVDFQNLALVHCSCYRTLHVLKATETQKKSSLIIARSIVGKILRAEYPFFRVP
ncbi:hypothetical protein HYQ44_010540 [Verticillium longisporum]|nr:hypothetical protein HYQ44_010540 [Verticillium longisporum]